MLFKLLSGIDRNRFTPHVISLSDAGSWGSRISALGIPVHAIGMRPGFPNPWAIWQLSSLLRTIRPSLVHTWMYHADLIGGIAARLAGSCALAWCIRHSNLSPGINKRSTLLVVAVCARLSRWLPHRILVCSESARQSHIDHGYAAEKMQVIPNGFDLSLFGPNSDARVRVRQELGLAPGVLLIGTVGRFHPQKNQLGFIHAMGILFQRNRNTRFVLIGHQLTRDNVELLRAAKENGIEHACYFLGSRNDVPLLMAALDVFVSASLGEAFPNVLGEAMACAIPCVATDVGDCAYILGDTGRVVAPDDALELATAAESLLSMNAESRLDLGYIARSRVEELFEIGFVVSRFEQFYDDLVMQTTLTSG